jgi:hypothetical protein
VVTMIMKTFLSIEEIDVILEGLSRVPKTFSPRTNDLIRKMRDLKGQNNGKENDQPGHKRH